MPRLHSCAKVSARLQRLLFLEHRRWAARTSAIPRLQEPDPRLALRELPHQKKRYLLQIGILSERSSRSIGRLLHCPRAPCAGARRIASDSLLPRRCLATRLAAIPPC